jgi:ATP-binding cassette subfamily F protein uup
LEAEQTQISATLAGTEIYVNEPKRVAELQARFAQIDEALMLALERWETLGAR